LSFFAFNCNDSKLC